MSQRLAIWPSPSNRRSAPEAPKRPDLKLVQGRNPRRISPLSPKGRVIALLVAVVAALFAIVSFHVVLSQGQFALEAMHTSANEQQAQYERLRLQVSTLESPSKIAGDAKERLGLVPAEQVTALAPTAEDMPKGLEVQPEQSGATGSGFAEWTQIKPHLSSSAP